MAAQFHTFIHLLFVGIVALFPVVNPIGTSLIISPYLSRLSEQQKKIVVKKITLYSFFICLVTLFAGQWILKLFGISIPVIQIAGGILICKVGWESLSAEKSTPKHKDMLQGTEHEDADISDKVFYPLTFPMTTGAGTISVLFTLSAQSASHNWKEYLINVSAILLSIVTMCALIFIFFSRTKAIVAKLGVNGQNIASRLFAFLIFCVGLDIAISGIKTIFSIGN